MPSFNSTTSTYFNFTNGTFHLPSQLPSPTKREVEWPKLTVQILSALAIAKINGFIILMFLKRSNLNAKPGNRILLSLAACDFVFGVSISVDIVHTVLQAGDVLSQTAFLAYGISANIATSIIQISAVLHLLVIAGERYISLFFPFEHRIYVTNTKVCRVLTTVWIVSVIYPLIQVVWLYRRFKTKLTSKDKTVLNLAEPIFSGLTATIFLLIPGIALAAAYIRMVFRVHRIISESRVISGASRHTEEPTGKEQKAVYIFATMYILFTILAMPFFIVRVVIDFSGILRLDLHYFSMDTLYGLYICRCIVSFLNPMVYIGCKAEIRKEAAKIFRRFFVKRRQNAPSNTTDTLLVANPQTSIGHPCYEKPDMDTVLSAIQDESNKDPDFIQLLPMATKDMESVNAC